MKIILFVLAITASAVYAQEVCDGVVNGKFVNDPSSCPGFFQCIDGIAKAGKCPEPYEFFEKEQHCSYAVGECVHYWTVQPGDTTTITPEVTTPAATYDCVPGDVHHLPHASSCTKYILCYNGVSSEKVCPDGLFFNPTELSCMDEAQSNCVENPCPAVDPADPLIFPNDRDCNSYFICLSGKPKEFNCYPDYVFDPTEGQCNKPANVDTAHCDGSGAATESPSP